MAILQRKKKNIPNVYGYEVYTIHCSLWKLILCECDGLSKPNRLVCAILTVCIGLESKWWEFLVTTWIWKIFFSFVICWVFFLLVPKSTYFIVFYFLLLLLSFHLFFPFLSHSHSIRKSSRKKMFPLFAMQEFSTRQTIILIRLITVCERREKKNGEKKNEMGIQIQLNICELTCMCVCVQKRKRQREFEWCLCLWNRLLTSCSDDVYWNAGILENKT